MPLTNIPNQQTGQSSLFDPGVTFDGNTYHMVWVANNPSRDLLYATSSDGINWTRGPNLNEKSRATPAVGILFGRVVAAFVADNDSRQIIYSLFDPLTGTWTHNLNTNESSRDGVAMVVVNNQAHLYFVANNASNELLEIIIALH